MRATNSATPRIYVASLSDYVGGRLHGVWVESVDLDVVQEAVAKLLSESPLVATSGAVDPQPSTVNAKDGLDLETAIHDFEGFGSYRLHEYDSLELTCAMGAAILEHGIVFADFVGHLGAPKDADEVADLVERFQEAYQGEFDSLEDWAEQFLEDTGGLKDAPKSFRPYIDLEKWADDAQMNGDIITSEEGGKVNVFWA
jgi:antirestriction protein